MVGSIDLSGYDLRPFYENDFGRSQKIAREDDLISNLTIVFTWPRHPQIIS